MGSLVSIIIPTYFRNERLREALESIESQTHRPIEVIVVDDSGERHAKKTVSEFEEREIPVQYLAHKKNEGAHAARDTGLQYINGDFVQFLDDDDRLKPEKIARQIEFIQSNEEVGVVYCGFEYDVEGKDPPEPTVRGNVLGKCLRFFDMPDSNEVAWIDGIDTPSSE